MKYTVKDLRSDFPNEEACLDWLVNWLYPEGITCKHCQQTTKHHKIKNRRVYSCQDCGTQISPTSGTIFHKSSTPLTDWFYAIYLMSTDKAGTSAKQIERVLGVSYPTAFRMMHQIRSMMDAPEGLLVGEVEVDETFFHANSFKRSSARKRYGFDARRSGQIVVGIAQRGGAVKMRHVKSTGERALIPFIRDNVKAGTIVHTDGWRAYKKLSNWGYPHKSTEHGIGQYWTEDSNTQTIEAIWSTMKPRIKGTFRHITPKYLQNYINEYAWRYSHRNDASMFWSLMGRIDKT